VESGARWDHGVSAAVDSLINRRDAKVRVAELALNNVELGAFAPSQVRRAARRRLGWVSGGAVRVDRALFESQAAVQIGAGGAFSFMPGPGAITVVLTSNGE